MTTRNFIETSSNDNKILVVLHEVKSKFLSLYSASADYRPNHQLHRTLQQRRYDVITCQCFVTFMWTY